MKKLIIIMSCLLQLNVFADEQKPKDLADMLWRDGKITPEQPFKANVVAAGGLSPWSGETVIYLREDGKSGRLLQVVIGFATGGGIKYTEITQNDFDETLKQMSTRREYHSCVFFEPVDVSHFVWVTALGDFGKKLSDTDVVKRVYLESLEKDKKQEPEKPKIESVSKDKFYAVVPNHTNFPLPYDFPNFSDKGVAEFNWEKYMAESKTDADRAFRAELACKNYGQPIAMGDDSTSNERERGNLAAAEFKAKCDDLVRRYRLKLQSEPDVLKDLESYITHSESAITKQVTLVGDSWGGSGRQVAYAESKMMAYLNFYRNLEALAASLHLQDLPK